MTRMRILSREDMNDEQGMLYDSFVEDGKPHAGPYWAYVRHPSLMQLCSDIGDWFRGSALSGRERQIAVLTTVRFWDANYPWAVQVRASLAAGVDQDTIDAINERRDPGLTDPREKMAHEMAAQLTTTLWARMRHLSQPLMAAHRLKHWLAVFLELEAEPVAFPF